MLRVTNTKRASAGVAQPDRCGLASNGLVPGLLETGWVTRNGLPRSAAVVASGRTLRVAWVGGSITWAPGLAAPSADQPPGYRDLTSAQLQRRVGVPVAGVNAALSGTGSDLAAFRVGRDALQSAPDLVVVEFAANDETIPQQNRLRGIEGTVRAALLSGADVCLVYTTTRDHMEALGRGELPATVRTHECIADHYGVPSVYAALPVVRSMERSDVEWDDMFVDHVHPSTLGHEHYADAVSSFLVELLLTPPMGHRAELAAPLDPVGWWNGRIQDVQPALANSSWHYTPRERCGGWLCFSGVLTATEPDPLRLAFYGRTLGVLVEVGPDSGILQWSIDDGCPDRVDLADAYTPYIVRPSYRLLSAGQELEFGWHVLELQAIAAADGHANVTLGALLVA